MKPVNNPVRDLLNLISSTGEYIDFGCDPESILIYQQMAYGLSLNKGVCAVSGWQILTIRPRDVERTVLRDFLIEYNLSPSFLVAEYIIYDDRDRFGNQPRIRTSFLVRYHGNCLFETENTIYILVGTGTRAMVSVQQAEVLIGRKGLFTE